MNNILNILKKKKFQNLIKEQQLLKSQLKSEIDLLCSQIVETEKNIKITEKEYNNSLIIKNQQLKNFLSYDNNKNKYTPFNLNNKLSTIPFNIKHGLNKNKFNLNIKKMKFDEKIQLIVVGESCVGKTSLLYK